MYNFNEMQKQGYFIICIIKATAQLQQLLIYTAAK